MNICNSNVLFKNSRQTWINIQHATWTSASEIAVLLIQREYLFFCALY